MISNDRDAPKISAQEVANLCFSTFKILPKTGKPKDTEWTVLAGVVLQNATNGRRRVISLACGTKCIGKSKLCPKGLILNDSHAEVLARRALIRYLYQHIRSAIAASEEDATDSIFQWDPKEKRCKLKDGLSFHFFSTQTPCGDACIINGDEKIEEPADKKRKVENLDNDKDKSNDTNEDIYTGAKLLDTQCSDSMEQVIGAVRTKPGRGERTLSMSCSDKLAKWQVMGVQGALIDLFLKEPIYFETLNFCGPNDISSLQRAIWKRFEGNTYESHKYRLHVPKIGICDAPNFEYAQNASKQPSPNGLVWCNIPESMRPYEVSVNGKRQGVTRKTQNSYASALSISRCHLFKEFMDIIKMKPEILPKCDEVENKTYLDIKLLATGYQKAWSDAKTKYFPHWSQKPLENLKFSLPQED